MYSEAEGGGGQARFVVLSYRCSSYEEGKADERIAEEKMLFVERGKTRREDYRIVANFLKKRKAGGRMFS